MAPLRKRVKAEILKCGSEKRDYRNLWWFGEIVHKLLLYRRGKKRKYQLKGRVLFLGEIPFYRFPGERFPW
jgi:hypothetical protein